MNYRNLLFCCFCLLALSSCEDEVLASLDSTEMNILAPEGPDMFSLVSVSTPSPRGVNRRAVRVTIDSDRELLDPLQQERIVGVSISLGAQLEFDRLSFIHEYNVGTDEICFTAAFRLEDGSLSRGTELCFNPE